MLTAGAQAPPFSLPDTNGKRISLEEALKQGPVLVAIYKAACPVSQMTLPFLNKIGEEAPPDRLQVIAISQDDESLTNHFRKKFKLAVPILLDSEDDGFQVSNAFGITNVPSIFLVESDGVISMTTQGFIKRDLESLGERGGVQTFSPTDRVPEWKAG